MAIACPTCPDEVLTLVQPDSEAPSKLLGACEACKGWYVVEANGQSVILIPSTPDAR